MPWCVNVSGSSTVIVCPSPDTDSTVRSCKEEDAKRENRRGGGWKEVGREGGRWKDGERETETEVKREREIDERMVTERQR